ncbi:hypothetical protein LJK88_48710 [Paenibacillus sp. P26]|nr:hypothetical protein LJK88_48710 [Paenibacillus sp. P26]UUZ91643.1 hypothetical protein LJK87_39605 [Paenibacillus sp. P25]
MFRYIPFLMGAALLISGLAACNTKDTHHEREFHSQDGTLGITEANPNVQMSTTYRTYPDDVRMIKTTINNQFPMVHNMAVNLNGPTAHVRLYVPPGTTAEEIARIRREAYRALTAGVPRYRMDVTVSAK